MVDGMTDERIGKTCGACGWLVTERDGEVALCMHDVAFLGPPPAIWVPLTEPMEARMLRFGHDGTVADLGSVIVEPVEPPPIVLAPWPEATATCSALDKMGETFRIESHGAKIGITPEEMREAVARFEAQPPREWRQEIQGEFRQRHEEPPTPWEPVSHGNAWRPVRLSVEPRTLTPEQERICEAVGRAIAGDPDVTLAPNYDGSRLSYFPEAPYPGEVVVGHDGKPRGVLLPNGVIKPLPDEVP
jgi:hypothetical protein